MWRSLDVNLPALKMMGSVWKVLVPQALWKTEAANLEAILTHPYPSQALRADLCSLGRLRHFRSDWITVIDRLIVPEMIPSWKGLCTLKMYLIITQQHQAHSHHWTVISTIHIRHFSSYNAEDLPSHSPTQQPLGMSLSFCYLSPWI